MQSNPSKPEQVTATEQASQSTEQLVTITNQTAVRIALEPVHPKAPGDSQPSEQFVLPAFGQRSTTGGEFNYKDWEQFGLVTTATSRRCRKTSPNATPSSKYASRWRPLLTGLLLLGIELGALWPLLPAQDQVYQIIRLIVIVAAFSIGGFWLLRHMGNNRYLNSLIDGFRKYPAIAIIGFGVPAVVILLSPRQTDAGAEPATIPIPQAGLDVLKHFFQSLTTNPVEILLRFFFVAIAATLPALLLYLFHSRRLNTLREGFISDIMRINPEIVTRKDAQITYGPLMNDILGKSPGVIHGFQQVPLLISTFLFALGWSLTLLVKEIGPQNQELFSPHRSALIFGFLGAYFFSINMIFRRYVRADLNTKTYTHMAIRVLSTFVLIWVVSVLLQHDGSQQHTATAAGSAATAPATTTPTATAQPQASSATADNDGQAETRNEPPVSSPNSLSLVVLYLLAFLVGIIPETATAVIQDFLRSQSWVGTFIPSLQEQHPLNKLEGITLYDQARLLEEGVENIENLAHHNLIELMLHTRIPTARLLDLVDQAILYLHARGPTANDESEDGLLQRLGAFGIRTATDLTKVYTNYRKENGEYHCHPILEKQLGSDQERQVQLILQTLEDDDWMVFLRRWRKLDQPKQHIYTLQQFLETFMPHRWPNQDQSTAKQPAGAPMKSAATLWS